MEAATGEEVGTTEFHKEFHTYTMQPGVFCDNKDEETNVRLHVNLLPFVYTFLIKAHT